MDYTSLRINPSASVALMEPAKKGFQLGTPVKDISFNLGVTLTTVYRWKRKYFKGGDEALNPRKRGRKEGTHRILIPEEEAQLQELIKGYEPRDFDINFSTWTRKAVSELTLIKLGIEISERTMGDYLSRWNFTPQKPVKKAYQQDPEKVKVFLEETFPTILERSCKEDAIIFFGDEAGIHSESFCQRSYSPCGITPVVKTTGSRLTLNLISAVSNTGELRYQTYTGSMNCNRFIGFLKVLTKSFDKKIFLILDNLRVHHGKMVQEWLKKNKKIELVFLPPYSPELNPDEYFNHLTKQAIHSKPQAATKEEFFNIIRKILHCLQKDKAKLRRLFQNKHIEYAKAV